MNLFEAVKENVNLKRAAEYYGLEVRNGMTLCIFHDERTPSMKLYDDHFSIPVRVTINICSHLA